MAKLRIYFPFLSVLLVTVTAIKPPKQSSSITTELLHERVSELSRTQDSLKRKVTRITAQSASTTERLTAIEQQLETHEELATVKELLIQSEAKNQELTRMLSNFERFFGALYAETPESFDPSESVDVRMSRLNSYLGNREATLLALRPAPTTIVDEETVNQELLGNALYEMSEERSNFERKLRRLEERLARVAEQAPNNRRVQELLDEFPNGVVDDADDPLTTQDQSTTRPRPGPNSKKNNTKETEQCNCRQKRNTIENQNPTPDELLERLERIENLMVLQLVPLLNETLKGSSFRGLGSPSDVLYNLTQLEQIEEELSAFRGISKPDSKKVAFSAARTTHFFGRSTPEILEFDHVFLNKGGHFNEDNSTLVCGVTGYYFVTFTVRSFDGYVLGIILMKNEDHVTSIFTDENERNVMETQSVIVHLEKGDILWLRHPPSERFAIHSDRYRYTTFSAFLIFKGY